MSGTEFIIPALGAAFQFVLWRLAEQPPRRFLLTAGELAARLGVTVEAVNGWRKSGRIPFYRVGPRSYAYDPDEVRVTPAAC